jgi:hypothetical protein
LFLRPSVLRPGRHDLGTRGRARIAPVDFEWVTANDDSLRLEGYFFYSLHQHVPFLPAHPSLVEWAGDSMVPWTVIIAFPDEWLAIRSTHPHRLPRWLALTTRQTLARMARLSLLRQVEFSFIFFGGLQCSL